MFTKQTKFIIAIVVQLVIILGMIVFNLFIINTGTKVLLKIEPIDPRDPLRGDYLHFTYKISSIPRSFFDYSPREGDTVYVPLRRSGKYWNVDTFVGKTRPEHGVYIKGEVLRVGKKDIRVKYGIEDYFIPEGSSYNSFFWKHEVAAEVVIDKNGNAVLEKIYVDGKPWP